MKVLLLTTFVATVCYVNAGKWQRMMAAMNGGMMGGMNGGMGNPGMMPGGLNPPMLAGRGAGFIGQPQFAQFVPGVPSFGANMFPLSGINALPQMAPMNPLQQPLMALTGGAMQQQVPPQPDPLQRFRRQVMKQENTLKTNVDTQIPAPTDTTTTPCDDDHN